MFTKNFFSYLFLDRWQNPLQKMDHTLHHSFCGLLQTASVIIGARKENHDDNDCEHYVADLSDIGNDEYYLDALSENDDNIVLEMEVNIADCRNSIIRVIPVLRCGFKNSEIYIASHFNFKGYFIVWE